MLGIAKYKSHHRHSARGAQPLYLDAFPLREYSMYGSVPLSLIKLLPCKTRRRSKLDRVRMLLLPTAVRWSRLQHAPSDRGMPRHQAGPDLPALGQGMVCVRQVFAVPPPAHGHGRRSVSRGALREGRSWKEYEDFRREVGRNLTRKPWSNA